jgi:nucleotide-binding universal stress UspA family protein
VKTLLTTDGSGESLMALRTAARLLRRARNEVHLLCVAPQIRVSGRRNRTQTDAEYERRITEESRAILEQTWKALVEEEIEVQPITDIGSPADVIVKAAEDYDVTVVGATGRGQSPRLGLGPVAGRVVEHASGTVLVARQLRSTADLRVLAAIDGSDASKRALMTMATCFNVDSAEITLLHVKETPWIHLGLDRQWSDFPGDAFDRSDPGIQLEEELQREAEGVLETAHAMLERYDYSVLTAIEEGNPATEILGKAESADYDLIVLGATGLRNTKHGMLGSVSAKVAAQAPCSVAIVKTG